MAAALAVPPEILRPVLTLAGCIALVWVFTRGALARAALRRVLTQPALLVPAAMTTAALAVLLVGVRTPGLHENPFGVRFAGGLGVGRPLHWAALAVVGFGLAGQIGLLEAAAAGRRPNAAAMLRGVRRHFGTFALAKVAVAGGAYLVSTIVDSDRAGLVLYLVPSLFLAPVAGTASLHPGHPLRALRAAIGIASRDLFVVGWPVLTQALALIGLLFLLDRTTPIAPDLLTFSTSTVSFNHFPFALVPAPGAVTTMVTAASVFVSAVYVTLHWTGARLGYHGPIAEPVRDIAA